MARKKDLILVLDTETTNTITGKNGRLDMTDVLFYDIGWAIIDKKGNIYKTRSFVNRDIFLYERDLMKTAYYADKLPQYYDEIAQGSRVMADLYTIRKVMLEDISNFKVKYVCAHNARFDCNALQRTQSYVTKSKFRYWFDFDSVIWLDSLKMARSLIMKMPTYVKFCEKHGFLTKAGKPQCSAEVLYKFISKNVDFVESHTGLEDVMIEKEIVAYCYRQHKKFEKELYPDRIEYPQMTEFQRNIWKSLKHNPTLRLA